MAFTGSGLTSRFRLMTSWDKLDQINFNTRLIREIGHVQWEIEVNRRHRVRMTFFDDETTHLEKNGTTQDGLDSRRFLLVQLNTEHYNLMTTVMELYHEQQNV